MKSSFGVFALLLCLGACSGASPKYEYSKEFDPRKHEYVLGPADTLRVTVWRNQELSSDAVVRPDGTITLPLIGDLQVAGRTPGQVREEITNRLSAYVKDESAVVTVAVTGVNSYRFTVAGNVARAGTFNSRYYVTVAEAIAMAGGPTRFAATDRILLVRADKTGQVRQIPINYDDVRARRRPEQDLVLIAGDTVFVP